jgi:zinc protease
MLQFSEFSLENGLRVIHHEDTTTPLAHINILYNVGSRDENPEHTGLAHLFEHLMFGGSINIPEYDTPLQKAGGSNNAFTNSDFTNYYLTLPAENIETGFWLESDRMLSLDFSQKSLDVQKGVVIEEFRQRYLNQPYGDFWLKLRELAFKSHPYSWATIGKNIDHISKTTLEDIKQFFHRFYNPSNAIMCIAGNISLEKSKELTYKWFHEIPPGYVNQNHYTAEPVQTQKEKAVFYENVPQDMIALAFHICGRTEDDYYAVDLISDWLGRSESSILYDELVRKKSMFTDINAYISGETDPGLLVIQGRLAPGIKPEDGEKAIWSCIDVLKSGKIEEEEVIKIKNKVETAYEFGLLQTLNRAMSLCIGKYLGNIQMINQEPLHYAKVSGQDIVNASNQYLTDENAHALYYLAKKS